jgi:hypothetical protein
LKSNLSLSGVIFEPFWWTCGQTNFLSQAKSKCVAECKATVSFQVSASHHLNFFSAQTLDFAWCSASALWNHSSSTFSQCSKAKSFVISKGKP